jgi:hypothetical protein
MTRLAKLAIKAQRAGDAARDASRSEWLRRDAECFAALWALAWYQPKRRR